jgi:LacI family repressor for deo operon, udp, cdd, tsx, nupC, and nupG
MVGIDDVARVAGVSNATVSRALTGRGSVAGTTQQHVISVAAELGYVASAPASHLASGRSRTIGVIVPSVRRWFYATVLEAAQDELTRAGFDLTLYNLGGGADTRGSVFTQLLHRGRTDGLIAISLEVAPEEASSLLALGKPVVCVGGPIEGLHTLSVDDLEMSRSATDHLAALGHTRIALIGGAPGHKDFHLPVKRSTGYELALKERRLPFDPALVETGSFTIESGYQAAMHLLKDEARRPTAIFAVSDEMAMGAILAARSLGLTVPEDLSVVGIDDHEHSSFFGLTTVAQYPGAQGSKAVRILLEQLRGVMPADGVGDHTDQPFDLVIRSSTAPPASTN